MREPHHRHHRLLNPVDLFAGIWRHRDLIGQLTRREVVARYRGSFLGVGWSLVQPLVMLCIYTFVFSTIFKARWGIDPQESRVDFALALFVGIVTYGIFSDTLNMAPLVIVNNTNLVKKVVFPVEVLAIVSFLGNLVNAVFGLAVLLVAVVVLTGGLHWTLILLPFAWCPILFLGLGVGFLGSSLGVFFRDLPPIAQLLSTMLFFMSPILYPVSAVPESYRFIYHFNPIAICVEEARRVILWGTIPDVSRILVASLFSFVFLVFCYNWFSRCREAFADVL